MSIFTAPDGTVYNTANICCVSKLEYDRLKQLHFFEVHFINGTEIPTFHYRWLAEQCRQSLIDTMSGTDGKVEKLQNSSWANDVDRQGGSFSDSEIRSAGCWHW